MIVSVVVPVHGRAALTRRCLDAVLAHPPEQELELLVVDDASPDRTPEVLAGYGDRLRVIRRSVNGGFAVACNQGAAGARGNVLVFLNNDTVPTAGWLDALIDDAEANPRAAVVGSKLVFPDGTVQHAGVVIGQDGYPRHLYAGFPENHPAVNRSRRFQAVTAASALVRRSAFESANGFDTEYRNGLEDLDLCLRLGEAGHHIRYCHRSVVYHLESATRGKRSRDHREGLQLYERRWKDRLRRDDIEYYLEDRLLHFLYEERYPARLEISPRLAVPTTHGENEERDLLHSCFRHLTGLLAETIRLTAHVAELELGGDPRVPAPPGETGGSARSGSLRDLLRRADDLEVEVARLQEELVDLVADQLTQPEPSNDHRSFTASRYLGYRKVLGDVRAAVDGHVPPDATVLVVSKGDEELLDLGSRQGWHFPRSADGAYCGHHPKDSRSAILALEKLREQGADYFVLPSTSSWWLDHYVDFAAHLESQCATVFSGASCRIVALCGQRSTGVSSHLEGD